MTTVTYDWEFVFITYYDAAIYAMHPDGTPDLETKVKAAVANMRSIMRVQSGITIMSQRVDSGGLYYKVTLCRNQATYDKYYG